MSSATLHPLPRPSETARPLLGYEAAIVERLDDGRLRLDDGTLARPALGCLVRPEVGDRVLYGAAADGEAFILQPLAREGLERAELTVPGARGLDLSQTSVTVSAVEEIALRSLKDLEATAATGTLRLTARNLFTTVSETLVENARHHVAHIGDYALKVKALLRIHGRQGIVTAEKDLKMDAERISMG